MHTVWLEVASLCHSLQTRMMRCWTGVLEYDRLTEVTTGNCKTMISSVAMFCRDSIVI